MKVYIVEIGNNYSDLFFISDEGYTSFEKAVSFIENRSDKPQRVNNSWRWISSYGEYRIKDITVV